MKYFMSVYSPSRNCRRNFVMNIESARHYYNEWFIKDSDAEIMRKYTNGKKIYRSRSRVMYIWGEDISDQELFKRQLAGLVDQEAWED